jgi:ribose transport system substrate-binding protein
MTRSALRHLVNGARSRARGEEIVVLDRFRFVKTAAAGLAVGAVAFAGCGGSSAGGGGNSGGDSATDVAAAKAAVAQYSGKPTAFPVDQPLKQRPTGKTFAYFQCSTPVCALFAQIAAPTQKLLGYQLKVVKAGASATEVQNAMDSIVSLKPAGVILPASDPNQFLHQMQALQQAKVPVSANGIVDPEKYGLQADFLNNETNTLGGKLMADWAVAQGGEEVAFYGVPELSYTPIMQAAFDREIAKLCPSCKVRHIDVPVAAIGKTAPSLVVSDLQSHPNTKSAVFATAEAGTGLPAALKAAQLKPHLMGWGPPPAVLGYMKQGQWDAAIGVDGFTMLWAQIDALARMSAGQPITDGQKQGLPPIQILTRKDITFDPTQGWMAYPDFAQRFAKLWGAGA